MSEYKIAVKIAGQLESSFNAAINGAQKGLSALGAIGSVGAKSLQIAQTALTATTAAIGAVGVASVKVGSDFESAMSSAAATAGATAEEYEKLEAAAMEMGKTTSKTATESANALEYMALAGWDVDTSIQALPSILKMSEASGMELARTSDLVTDSMAALGVTVDQLPGYLDIAAKAQNKSNQSAEQLMEAYLGVGGTMNNLHVPLEESATALGVLANRGIKGSEAGNALNAIMVNLTTGTGQAGKAMESLGVSAFDSQGNFIGLEETLQQLNTALAGCTEEERNAALAAIGGKTHVDALNDLMAGLNTTNEEGISEWQALTSELENANGALETMRDTKLDNLQGDLATLGSAAQDAGIKIYKNLQGPLRGVVQYGTSALYRLSDALEEGGLSGMATELGSVLADGLQQIVNYAPQILSAVEGLIGGLLSGLRNNAGSLGQSASMLVSSLLQGFMRYYADFWVTAADLMASFLEGLVSQMPQIIETGIQAIQNLASGILSRLPTIARSAVRIAVQLIQGLSVMLPMLINFAAQAIAELAQALAEGAPDIITAGVELVFSLVQSILSNIPLLIQAALQLVRGIAQGILSGLQYIFTNGVEIVTSLTNGILEALPELIQEAGEIITEFMSGLQEQLPTIIQGGIMMIQRLVQGIIENLPTIVMTAVNVILQFFQGLVAMLPTLVEGGVQLIISLINGIVQMLPVILQTAIQAVLALLQGILSQLPTIIQAGIQLIVSLIQGIVAALPSIIQAGISMIGSLVEGIVSAIPMILQAIIQGIIAFIQGIAANIGTIIESGMSMIGALVNGLIQAIPALIAAIPQIIGAFIEALFTTNWLEVGWEIIKAIGEGIWNGAKSIFKGIGGFFKNLFGLGGDEGEAVGSEYAEGIATGIENESATIQGAAESSSALVASAYQPNEALLQQYGASVNTAYATGLDSTQYMVDMSAYTTGITVPESMVSGMNAGADGVSAAALDLASMSADTLNTEMLANLPAVDAASLATGTALTEGITSGIDSGLAGAQSSAAEASLATINAMSEGIQSGADTINNTISELTASVAERLNSCWEAVSASTTEAWGSIGEGIASAMESLNTSVSGAMTSISEGISSAGTSWQTAMQTVMTGLQTTITTAFTGIRTTVQTALSSLGTSVTSGMTGASAAMRAAFTAMNTVTRAGMTAIQNAVRTGSTAVRTAVTTAATGARTSTQAAVSAIRSLIQSAISQIRSQVTSETQQAVSTVQSGMQQLVSAVQNGCRTALQAAQATANGIRSTFASVSLYSAGANMMQGLINGLNAMRSRVIETARGIAQAAASAVNSALQVHSPSRLMEQTGEFTGQGLVEGMESTRGAVQQAATTAMAMPVQETAQAIRTFEVPEVESRSSVIGETIGSFSEDGSGARSVQQGEAAPTFVFSPTYHFEGEAPSKEDIVEANRMSQNEFEKMMKEYLRKNKRVAFA